MTLPVRISKRVKAECLHCQEPAVDGSDFCAPHDARERAQRSGRQRRLRERRASEGVCAAGCGRRVPKRRRPNGTPMPKECRRCSEQHRKRTADARKRVRNERDACVTSDEPIPARGHLKLEQRGADDAARGWAPTARYVGRDRRGAPSKEDRRRDAVKSRDDALALAGVRFDRARHVYEQHVEDMPRIQREAAKAEVVDLLRRAARMLEDAAELYG